MEEKTIENILITNNELDIIKEALTEYYKDKLDQDNFDVMKLEQLMEKLGCSK